MALATAPAPQGEHEYLKVEEAAALMRVSRSTAYEMVQAGTLPVVRIGRAIRISRRRLVAWLEGSPD